MTEDIPSEDDPFVDESSAHRTVAGRTGTGKTTRLSAVMVALHAESAPEWIDPKADENVIDGRESQWD
ncbi:hypothetical protein MUK72_19290 (plasmid) [Halococcus dombrowskii]|uniref:Helicase HerA central domain-containing protein n=1 Tax=Halococcus dombrowskii TaxID=179637 RepID=A0AAV3SJ31_HALDO|nr:hypothetical protein [Halococcus dombrowskii]UOO97297.1 hypothetical protein MUK72_19290 [Halococcus dombrowskii]